MLNLYLEDNEWEKAKSYKDREVVRAVVLENDKILILQINRDDAFGNARYLETPGGGVDIGESLEGALKRELDEELGVKVEILQELGTVTDYYNKLNRRNINHYFLVKVIGYTKIHHVSVGDSLIEGILKLDIDDILKEYQKERTEKIIRLVYNREEPVFKETLKYLG